LFVLGNRSFRQGHCLARSFLFCASSILSDLRASRGLLHLEPALAFLLPFTLHGYGTRVPKRSEGKRKCAPATFGRPRGGQGEAWYGRERYVEEF